MVVLQLPSSNRPTCVHCVLLTTSTGRIALLLVCLQVVLPQLCFDDEDAQLWEEDPQEFVRKVGGRAF
jgi:hypothetical protein